MKDVSVWLIASHNVLNTSLSSPSDAPTVTLEGAPSEDIEESVDDVTLRCLVDSNPAANVVWRLVGQTDVFSFQPEVRFSPASRKHSATYTCEARNAVGGSDPISVKIDVKCKYLQVCCSKLDFATDVTTESYVRVRIPLVSQA